MYFTVATYCTGTPFTAVTIHTRRLIRSVNARKSIPKTILYIMTLRNISMTDVYVLNL